MTPTLLKLNKIKTGIVGQRSIGVILSYLSIFLNVLLLLFFTPILIDYLGPSQFGIYSLSIALITYISLADFGLGNAVVVFSTKYLRAKAHVKKIRLYSTVFIVYCAISILFSFGMIFARGHLDDWFSKEVTPNEVKTFTEIWLVLAILALFYIPLNLFKSILVSHEEFFVVHGLSLLRIVAIPFFLFIGMVSGTTLENLVTSVCAVTLTVMLIQAWCCIKKAPLSLKLTNFDWMELRSVLTYSLFIFLATFVDQVNWNYGQLLLAAYVDAATIGIYSIASMIGLAYVMLATAISNVMLPKITTMVAAGADGMALTREMIRVGRLQCYVVGTTLGQFVVFGNDLILFWLGHSFADVYILSLALMAVLTIPLVQSLGLSILQAKNKFKFRAVSSFIVSILTIIVSVPLTRAFGYYGLITAIAASIFVLNGIVMNFYYSKIGIFVSLFWRGVAKPIFCLSLAVLFAIFLSRFLEVDGIFDVVMAVAVGAGMTFLLCYFICFDEYEKSILSDLIKGLRLAYK